nr:LOW QUALITY PROTEIN: uncharacterized protein LOC108070039 [Drosophila takahashii]
MSNLSKFEFTNINCTSLDNEFDSFEYCFLKSVNRTYKYVSIKVNLFKTPVTKVKVHFSLNKRFSGYRPFLYNVTVDACRFLQNPASNPIADILFDKINVEFVNHRFSKVLPFPEGDYYLESNWMAYDINRAVIKVYGTLS